jgi:Zinc carboxypeptidase
MSRTRTGVLLMVALVISGLLLVVFTSLASASRQAAGLLPPPVPPEPYPNTDIYPAVVYLRSSTDLELLYRMNIDIDGLQAVDHSLEQPGLVSEPSIATIYINATQSEILSQAGIQPVPIPNEGYRSFLAYGPRSGAPDSWPAFSEYVTRMQNLAGSHADIVRLVQIGVSVQLRPLYCLKITDHPDLEEDEPEFKYTANHHGDETTGIEMTMRLAELLANSYGTDPELTHIVDEMETWLCPIYNPDGYVSGNRYNAHGVDLNRDFPDRFTDPLDDPTGHEPETQAFMNFGYAHRFVMGANYHGGAQVLNYPWDAVVRPGRPIVPAYAPDDDLFHDLGYGYTSRNTDLWNGGFPEGMTRGWEWYQVWGGMQDWAYFFHGEHHVTLEISPFSPPFEQMDTYWLHNRDAMVWWMRQAMTGLGGLVVDARDNAPLDADITLVGRAVPNLIHTDPDVGDYHRVISPGIYTIEASASCYQSQSAQVTIPVEGTGIIQDFFLHPMIDLNPSTKTASVSHAYPGEVVDYQLRLENTCFSTLATITDTLPLSVTWTGELTATQGIPTIASGQILWQGELTASNPVTITYAVSLNDCLPAGTPIYNVAELSDGVTNTITRSARVEVSNSAPTIPSSPFPMDGASDQPITTALAWAGSEDLNCDAITYDLAFGTAPAPAIVSEGISGPGYNPGGLVPGTTYYWRVIAHDGLEDATGPIWSFSTVPLRRIFLPLGFKS